MSLMRGITNVELGSYLTEFHEFWCIHVLKRLNRKMTQKDPHVMTKMNINTMYEKEDSRRSRKTPTCQQGKAPTLTVGGARPFERSLFGFGN